MEERITYSELKEWFFKDAYRWCQIKFDYGRIRKWAPNESEWGGALDTYDGSFDLPIENLMIYVIYIILRSGRNPYGHQATLRDIDRILSEHHIEDLISPLGEEEREEFLYDLNLVLNNRELE